MQKNRIVPIAVLASLTAIACVTVVFDTGTGVGSVDVKDVGAAFGWTTTQLTNNASGVTFLYRVTDTVDVTCTWAVSEGAIPENMTYSTSMMTEWPVLSSLALGRKNVVAGYNLNGFAPSSTLGSIPKVGSACGYAWPTAVVSGVTLKTSNKVLEANYAGAAAKIPLPVRRGK